MHALFHRSYVGRSHSETAAALALTVAAAASAQVTQRFVDPLVTDPGIGEVELPLADAEGVTKDHVVYTDPTTDNGRLLVWLAGTGGAPAQYQVLGRAATRVGFDVLGLTYDSWPAVNAFTTNSDDPTLPERIRRERLFGEDLFDLINVDPANSVENRLLRLIEHQAQNHPGEDWDRYLTDAGGIDWRRVVTAGHSQGAGHAVYLSKEFELAGALIFAGPGDFVQGLGTAPWVFEPGLTPAERIYAFTHVDDPTSAGFYNNQRILGLEQFGLIQNVDGRTVDQITSHMLASTRFIDHGNYHSGIAVDALLPIEPDGSPTYLPAWRSMFQRVGPTPCARADFSADGVCRTNLSDGAVTLSDFSCYLSAWSARDPAADITQAGACLPTGGDGVTLSDFSCYLALWSQGCP